MVNIDINVIPGLTINDTKIRVTNSGPALFEKDTPAVWGLDNFNDVAARWAKAVGRGSAALSRYYFVPDPNGGEWTGGNQTVVNGDGSVNEEKSHGPALPSARIDVVVKSAAVVAVDEQPVIVDRQVIDARQAPVPVSFAAQIADEVTKTVESNWQESTDVGVSVTVGVEAGSEDVGAKVSASTTVSLSHSWGEGGSKSVAVDVGNNLQVSGEVPVGQIAVAAMTLNRGSMDIAVEYEVSVSGYAQLQYWGGFLPGHTSDFIYVSLAGMLEALQKGSSTRSAKQQIVVDYLADGVAGIYAATDIDPGSLNEAVLGKVK